MQNGSETSERSTEKNSQKSTSSPEGFPASLFPLQEIKMEKEITAISGRRCLELYPKSGRLGSLLKMFLESSTLRSTMFSMIWRVRATKRSRLYFRLTLSERPTEETGCGLWATPQAFDGVMPMKSQEDLDREALEPGERKGRARPGNLRDQIAVAEGMRLWPTPDCSDRRSMKSKQQGLSNAVKIWPTPRATRGGSATETVRKMFPTPTACDHKGAGPTNIRKDGKDRSNDRLDYATYSPDGGKLNPQWVELLMGIPSGWTST